MATDHRIIEWFGLGGILEISASDVQIEDQEKFLLRSSIALEQLSREAVKSLS